MNPATQRPGDLYPSYPFWYKCQADCWGMQHEQIVQHYFNAYDGMVYQRVDYLWDSYYGTYDEGIPVLHGPAPKSWVDQSDFGLIIPDFC